MNKIIIKMLSVLNVHFLKIRVYFIYLLINSFIVIWFILIELFIVYIDIGFG